MVLCLFNLNLKIQASILELDLCRTWSKNKIVGFLSRRLTYDNKDVSLDQLNSVFDGKVLLSSFVVQIYFESVM